MFPPGRDIGTKLRRPGSRATLSTYRTKQQQQQIYKQGPISQAHLLALASLLLREGVEPNPGPSKRSAWPEDQRIYVDAQHIPERELQHACFAHAQSRGCVDLDCKWKHYGTAGSSVARLAALNSSRAIQHASARGPERERARSSGLPSRSQTTAVVVSPVVTGRPTPPQRTIVAHASAWISAEGAAAAAPRVAEAATGSLRWTPSAKDAVGDENAIAWVEDHVRVMEYITQIGKEVRAAKAKGFAAFAAMMELVRGDARLSDDAHQDVAGDDARAEVHPPTCEDDVGAAAVPAGHFPCLVPKHQTFDAHLCPEPTCWQSFDQKYKNRDHCIAVHGAAVAVEGGGLAAHLTTAVAMSLAMGATDAPVRGKQQYQYDAPSSDSRDSREPSAAAAWRLGCEMEEHGRDYPQRAQGGWSAASCGPRAVHRRCGVGGNGHRRRSPRRRRFRVVGPRPGVGPPEVGPPRPSAPRAPGLDAAA